MSNKIYTHDEAAKIIDLFEEILSRYNIYIFHLRRMKTEKRMI